MDAILQICKNILSENNTLTCVMQNNNVVYRSALRGISPLLSWLSADSGALRDAYVADKVIGKAAALLMVYGGVAQVYAAVISRPAADCFDKNGIQYVYDKKVEYIINRTGDGLCPMEQCCLDIDSPETAYTVLKEKLAHL